MNVYGSTFSELLSCYIGKVRARRLASNRQSVGAEGHPVHGCLSLSLPTDCMRPGLAGYGVTSVPRRIIARNAPPWETQQDKQIQESTPVTRLAVRLISRPESGRPDARHSESCASVPRACDPTVWCATPFPDLVPQIIPSALLFSPARTNPAPGRQGNVCVRHAGRRRAHVGSALDPRQRGSVLSGVLAAGSGCQVPGAVPRQHHGAARTGRWVAGWVGDAGSRCR